MQERVLKKRVITMISLPIAIRREIASEVGVSIDTVDNALKFRTYGEQPERIRSIAFERGGVKERRIKWCNA
jgi:hypothetical protein